jgi:hypothetical protein
MNLNLRYRQDMACDNADNVLKSQFASDGLVKPCFVHWSICVGVSSPVQEANESASYAGTAPTCSLHL